MKKIVKFAMVVVALLAMGCSEPNEIGTLFLDVTPNNISGVWRMASYDGGQKLGEGTFYYIEFDRKDKTFVSYDNLGSMGVVENSGRYDIVIDGAAVIRGTYDFGRGDWEHSYYVRNLTQNSMCWVATDDETIMQVYERAELPEELQK